jgi:hypothetical protein
MWCSCIWKNDTQKEVDFIISEKNRVTRAIQVCWDMSSESTRKREVESLVAAMETFGLKEGLILTDDTEDEIELKDKKIIVKPVWKWLLS